MKITVHAIIEIPNPPNFFRMEGGQTIPISAISEDGLYEIGKQWTEALIKRASEQKSDDA